MPQTASASKEQAGRFPGGVLGVIVGIVAVLFIGDYWRQLFALARPTDALGIWTMVLALATLAVAIVAAYGLKSLRLTRTEMRNRATREAAQCAIDHCDQMSRDFVPNSTKLFGEITSRGVKLFVDKPEQVSFEAKEETRKINRAIEWMQKLNRDELQRIVDLMNRLECWSMAFTHDPALAEERFAFEPCSQVFCQLVVLLYPALLTQRRMNPSSGPFQNTVTLFNGWYAKMAKGPIMEQLKRLESDGARLPPTLGSNVDEDG